MLAFNHCQDAFWVGILKNRDLQVRIVWEQLQAGKGWCSPYPHSCDSPFVCG